MDAGHPLAAVLRDAASGHFPTSDGVLEVLPPLEGIAAGLFSFTGLTIISTDLQRAELEAHLPSKDPGAPMNPGFIAWLAQRLNARGYTPDAVLAAFRPEGDGASSLVERPDLMDHPRALLARRYRRDVRYYSDSDGNGLLTAGYGVCRRMEVSVEVEPALRNRGLARRLVYAARSLAPAGEPVFAGISPGNAASLRAFLAAGYFPIGAEVLMLRGTAWA